MSTSSPSTTITAVVVSLAVTCHILSYVSFDTTFIRKWYHLSFHVPMSQLPSFNKSRASSLLDQRLGGYVDRDNSPAMSMSGISDSPGFSLSEESDHSNLSYGSHCGAGGLGLSMSITRNHSRVISYEVSL
jgi:hypothetical protein